ncbi:MAG: DUF839 domain-containing protein, partial [Candidatus Binatia bacterium]|nr:DUF839 domain-containing protein [Candidatus Binatia bacterium]
MSSRFHPDRRGGYGVEASNTTRRDSILDLIAQRQMSRRSFLGGALGVGALAALSSVPVPVLAASQRARSPRIGFTSVPPNVAPMFDGVTVPPGYTCKVLLSWGDAIMNGASHWDPSGEMTEAVQEQTFGAHIDGMHYFPLSGSRRGLLVTNHEYVDPGLVNNTLSYSTAPLTLPMV